ncbi:hypothetical protein [Ruminococcus sp.]|uniref:hypothetical protein n=1 Tax=Ruminococcus sp. TaxID=41978 RepID=UPI00388FD7D0
MKFYLQRDTSREQARYQIADEAGRLRYTVTGKRNPSGERIHIKTQNGETVCKIRSLGFSALSVYSISSGGESMRLNIAVGTGRAAIRFRGISFFVRGDVLMGSYSILDADTAVICTVGKDFARGCTQLELYQEEREIFCLATAICIDSLNVGQLPVLQMS